MQMVGFRPVLLPNCAALGPPATKTPPAGAGGALLLGAKGVGYLAPAAAGIARKTLRIMAIA